ncbi:MAG: hypothetical protein HY432_02220 [Candidatus Liptonbacteria bacterium]|nr:hypothetical protein [Candidatus Liptonbacteria bacterium]
MKRIFNSDIKNSIQVNRAIPRISHNRRKTDILSNIAATISPVREERI